MVNIISFRRYYLDRLLKEYEYLMRGRVLDIGGKRNNPRGEFKPPLKKIISWQYLNIDKATGPDFHCEASKIPVDKETFDTVLFCEVLEHLEDPEAAISEIHRVLKPGGNFVMSIPLLYQVHPDPYDYQRWTEAKILRELSKKGFKDIAIKPMGGFFAVVSDLSRSFLARSPRPRAASMKIAGLIYHLSLGPFQLLDRKFDWINSYITTGYFVVAKKQ